jgi:glycosyltransferase involved in cell wall biosynthesis
MSSLVVSSYTPALGSGRALRTYGIVRALAATGPVDLLYTRFGSPAPSADFTALDGVRLHEVRATHGARRAVTVARAVASGAPRAVARGMSGELANAAARLAAAPGRARIVATDPMAALALAPVARRQPVIYDAQNLESSFRRDWGSQRRLARFERALLERSAETWMPSRADVAGARALAPDTVVRLMPNVVDVAAIEPVVAAGTQAVMVADFTYDPNREGLDFLRSEVLPLAWETAPDLRLLVAGRGLDGAGTDERVSVLGFVDSLPPLYASAACAVVPLLTGGGSPLKFVEALAYGLPVVATPRAAAGLDVQAGEHYLEGADAPGFARALLTALGGAPAVAAAGRALAEREYSIEALIARLAA